MRKTFLFFSIILFSNFCQSQSIIGKWKTIDDVTGKAKSIVEIYENGGKYYGKIIEIIDKTKTNELCANCEGAEKNKPILGMIIIKGLIKKGKEFSSGKVLDPKTGSLYKCTITLESDDKLKVRGYIGISLLGRTQVWIKV